jgi:hypothetical protein
MVISGSQEQILLILLVKQIFNSRIRVPTWHMSQVANPRFATKPQHSLKVQVPCHKFPRVEAEYLLSDM